MRPFYPPRFFHDYFCVERLGWRFIRIRGSEYYRDPEKTIERVVKELSAFGIEPEEKSALPTESRTSELFLRVKNQAELALLKEKEDDTESNEKTIAAALDPMAIIREQPDVKTKLNEETDIKQETVTKPDEKIQFEMRSDNAVIKDQQPVVQLEIIDESITDTPIKKGSSAKAKSQKSEIENISSTEQHMSPKTEDENLKESNEIAYLKKNKIKYVDKRDKNGALWLVGGRELEPIVKECRKFGLYFRYKEEGGRQTGNKPGWWAK